MRGVRVLALTAIALVVVLLAYGLVAKAPNATIDDALARGESTPAPGLALDVLRTTAPRRRTGQLACPRPTSSASGERWWAT